MTVHEGDQPHVRASDAERQAVADRLRTALDEGRLDVLEYDSRLQAVFAATTRAELVPPVADLPEAAGAVAVSGPAGPPDPQRAAIRRSNLNAIRAWLSVSVILWGIWLVLSIPGFASGEGTIFPWPVFPTGIWGAVLLAGIIGGWGGQTNTDTVIDPATTGQADRPSAEAERERRTAEAEALGDGAGTPDERPVQHPPPAPREIEQARPILDVTPPVPARDAVPRTQPPS